VPPTIFFITDEGWDSAAIKLVGRPLVCWNAELELMPSIFC